VLINPRNILFPHEIIADDETYECAGEKMSCDVRDFCKNGRHGARYSGNELIENTRSGGYRNDS